ncbi:hypothetical protein J3F84DRAFT_368056 [Trichoderma pleuroticola]
MRLDTAARFSAFLNQLCLAGLGCAWLWDGPETKPAACSTGFDAWHESVLCHWRFLARCSVLDDTFIHTVLYTYCFFWRSMDAFIFAHSRTGARFQNYQTLLVTISMFEYESRHVWLV